MRAPLRSGAPPAGRAAVDAAKTELGERGPVWWTAGAPDLTRRMARTTYFNDRGEPKGVAASIGWRMTPAAGAGQTAELSGR
jgi:hypothetical protein